MIIYLLNLLMLSRIAYTFDDNKIGFKQTPYYLIIQGIGIATLAVNRAWIGLLISSVISNVLIILWERRTRNPRIVRIASLFGFSIIYSLFVNLSGNITFNPVLLTWFRRFNDAFSIVKNIDDLSRINTYSLGLLFIFNESNTIIRQLLCAMKLTLDHTRVNCLYNNYNQPSKSRC